MNSFTLGRPMRLSPYPERPRWSPALRGAHLGQRPIFDVPLVSFALTTGASIVGIYGGLKFSGTWSTVSWIVGIVSGIRALQEGAKLTGR